MSRNYRRSARLAAVALLAAGALLMGGAECDPFLDGDFEPTGTPFSLNSNLELTSITGGPQPVPTGTYTIDMTCRATGGAPANQAFPAGLLFSSTKNRVQHVVVLKSQSANFDVAGSRRSVGVFCCNRFRRTPDQLDTFDLGPVTDNGQLQEIAALVGAKDISGNANLWLVQRAVWMVTDSTGLTQAYRDSLAALPAAMPRGPGREWIARQ
ncbi:MAG: hypothetical protein R6X12_09215 [bacterium]